MRERPGYAMANICDKLGFISFVGEYYYILERDLIPNIVQYF